MPPRTEGWDWVAEPEDGWYALAIAVISQARHDAARETRHIANREYRREMERAKQSAVEFLQFLSTLSYPRRAGDMPAGDD